MKVYLYSRVSTDLQSTDQQERTVYEWLNHHNMHVDEIVTDEGVSGGVSFKDRNLGKILLPKMQAGDLLIVSEVSRLGRSMYDLSKLIHTELKPRKIRLVCVSMGIDLNCAKMTAIDELILNNFSFAAQLEKQLISERTLSALEVKRKQGVKFGSASETYKRNYDMKTEEQKKAIGIKRGQTRNRRKLESRDTQTLIKILQRTFVLEEDINEWKWWEISVGGGMAVKILQSMKDFKDMDDTGRTFAKWDFSDLHSDKLYHKLASAICNLKNSIYYANGKI